MAATIEGQSSLQTEDVTPPPPSTSASSPFVSDPPLPSTSVAEDASPTHGKEDEGFVLAEYIAPPRGDGSGVVRSVTLAKADKDISEKLQELEKAQPAPLAALSAEPTAAIQSRPTPLEAISTTTIRSEGYVSPPVTYEKRKTGVSVGPPSDAVTRETMQAPAITHDFETAPVSLPVDTITTQQHKVEVTGPATYPPDQIGSLTGEQPATQRKELGRAWSPVVASSGSTESLDTVRQLEAEKAILEAKLRKGQLAVRDLAVERDRYAKELENVRKRDSYDRKDAEEDMERLLAKINHLRIENRELGNRLADVQYRLSTLPQSAPPEPGAGTGVATVTQPEPVTRVEPGETVKALQDRIAQLLAERKTVDEIILSQDQEIKILQKNVEIAVRKGDELAAMIEGTRDRVGVDLRGSARMEDKVVKELVAQVERANAAERAALARTDELHLRLEEFAAKTVAAEEKASRNARLETENDRLQREVNLKLRTQRNLYEELGERDHALLTAERTIAQEVEQRRSMARTMDGLLGEREDLIARLRNKSDEASYLRGLLEDQRAEMERFLLDVTRNANETQRALQRLSTFVSVLPITPPRAVRGLLTAGPHASGTLEREEYLSTSRTHESARAPPSELSAGDVPVSRKAVERAGSPPRRPAPQIDDFRETRRDAVTVSPRKFPTSRSFSVSPPRQPDASRVRSGSRDRTPPRMEEPKGQGRERGILRSREPSGGSVEPMSYEYRYYVPERVGGSSKISRREGDGERGVGRSLSFAPGQEGESKGKEVRWGEEEAAAIAIAPAREGSGDGVPK
ncbi:hypothetical protein M427DRAFT_42266 [Gonapodya prolifera JEL478]|uniref:Uncharacterized protein n=1 Tax=Gonapodya prolifera (strain JEL478) TaxID=1344416 RepID=A0A139AQW8_GONPJ|nr:hypothetical protein M427DRAFT_42266 [Gonapodya prolifera JEL478]|eukprot:KXS19054.1 hypothetical protein M427DRAFT_42266 [Gonapodya prolifera JEL478]